MIITERYTYVIVIGHDPIVVSTSSCDSENPGSNSCQEYLSGGRGDT